MQKRDTLHENGNSIALRESFGPKSHTRSACGISGALVPLKAKAAWFYSTKGNNGKGTVCVLMRQLCGDGQCASVSLTDLGKDFMLEPLLKASAVVTDENDTGLFIDRAANLKAIVTGDSLLVNRKHQSAVTFQFRGMMIQCLNEYPTKTGEPLAPKSKKLIHGTLHAALAQAVESKHISDNPATRVRLPKQEKRDPVVVDGDDLKAYLSAIQGHQYEIPLTLYLFTGMRKNELLGLQWRDIDWDAGTITIARQIYIPRGGGKPEAAPVKNGKPRVIAPASFVMDLLRRQQHEQEQQRIDAGEFWNETDWVFTREDGLPLSPTNIYKAFKRVAAKIGLPEACVHDLRHSYSVASVRAGDDVKTIQANLGHSTAAFTLEVYTHVTGQMKRDSAARMDAYIRNITGNKK